jgi:glycosyltransferase involved in cell wall biosynthesis
MVSTEALADEIGGGAIHTPVASNITPIATTSSAARRQLGLGDRLVVALFGRDHPGRALEYADAAIRALADARGADGFVVLNLGADAPPVGDGSGVEVRTPGRLDADELSLRLWASDLVLLPFVDGVSTRRSTLMAPLAHARPVLALRGYNTDRVLLERPDALMLTPAGDPDAFARAAVALTDDSEQLRALGAAGHRLYTEAFDWPALARRVRSALAASLSPAMYEVAGAQA